ncbi:MAG: zinc-ribbon domain-containing protein [Alphaproteobacteria bacterium]|nr:zinc-ribbon domain-containing protein [Alphaproteobacteria bacterium]
MILTCPNCDMRYLVSAVSIGPEGRKVRCASCAHIWFQKPEISDSAFGGSFQDILKEEMRAEPIPESVKPLPEGSNVPALPEDVPPSKAKTKFSFPHLPSFRVGADRLAGYGAALGICLLLLAGLVTLRDHVVKIWPPSVMMFDMLGADTALAGEGLIIDRLQAKTEKTETGDVLKIKGSVINLTGNDVKVPHLLATLKMKDGSPGEKWLIELPQAHMAGEGAIDFSSEYPGLPELAESVHLTFSLSSPQAEPKPESEVTSDDQAHTHQKDAHAPSLEPEEKTKAH